LSGGINTFGYVGQSPGANVDPLGLFNVKGYEGPQGWLFKFEFENCYSAYIEEFMAGRFRWLSRGGRLFSKLGADPAGDVDISDVALRCKCKKLDPGLESKFRSKYGGYGTRLSESEASEALKDLKAWMKELEATIEKCPDCVKAYGWGAILGNAKNRGVPWVGHLREAQ
jgi:hypothetical protein